MSLVIAIVAAVFFLESPWNALVLIAAVAWEGFEIWLFLRWRGRKAFSGIDALVGARGFTVTACHPSGQARIQGRFWKVECAEGADVGASVEVVKVEGMLLHVTAVIPAD